jgi:hypothetical protein
MGYKQLMTILTMNSFGKKRKKNLKLEQPAWSTCLVLPSSLLRDRLQVQWQRRVAHDRCVFLSNFIFALLLAPKIGAAGGSWVYACVEHTRCKQFFTSENTPCIHALVHLCITIRRNCQEWGWRFGVQLFHTVARPLEVFYFPSRS